MGAFKQRFRPPAQRRVALSHIGQRRARSMDRLLAEICVAALADAEQLRFAAGRELLRDDAQPRRKITSSIKALRSPDRSGKRRGGDPPNPGIVVSRRASSFSFAQRMNSASKAAIRRSSSVHCARASATRRIIRALNPAPACPRRPVRPSARPGTARASSCPVARPSRVQAGWRAAD